LLIAEAEKAARALEIAALKDPLAEPALKEARSMIAQATQMLDSIEQGPVPAGSLNNLSSPDSDSSNQDPTKPQINGKNMSNFDQSSLNITLDGPEETINGYHILFNGLVGCEEIWGMEGDDEKSEGS
jgi:hypothetical protein